MGWDGWMGWVGGWDGWKYAYLRDQDDVDRGKQSGRNSALVVKGEEIEQV